MNENINLCEILRDCPKGTKLYSYVHGWCKFMGINNNSKHPIITIVTNRNKMSFKVCFSKEGILDRSYAAARCVLVPSLEQPDWSKWKYPTKFDPKTLQPFDKVLVFYGNTWMCDFFTHTEENNIINVVGTGRRDKVIPYNDDTKHLVGTSEEAPEFYRYWEK